MNYRYLFILFILLSFPSYALTANQTTDNSPTPAEVTSLIAAMSTGDTLTFAGDATWSESVTIDKAITIDGNSHTLTSSGSLSAGFFNLTGLNTTSNVRITGFIFQMAGADIGVQMTSGSITNLRIDHNTFHHGGTQMSIEGAKGVIDNNYFYNSLAYSIGYGAGSRAQADASWASMEAGTSDALFIEDNHFIKDANFSGSGYGTDIDTASGGKLVIRYNHFDSTTSPESIVSTTYPIQLHGSDCGGCSSGNQAYWQNDTTAHRGQSVVEIYNNIFEGRRIDRLATLRGSSVLIHDNQFVGTVAYSPIIYMYEEEYNLTSQFTPSRTIWPAEDQIHNTFIWNNTYNGSAWFNTSERVYSDGNLVQDKDYFLHAPCGASDSTDAYGNTCTHGVETFVCIDGVSECNGSSSSYPTDGDTYPTKGTMTFTETGDNFYYGYTPYTYPHPLRGTGKAAASLGSGASMSIGSGAVLTLQ